MNKQEFQQKMDQAQKDFLNKEEGFALDPKLVAEHIEEAIEFVNGGNNPMIIGDENDEENLAVLMSFSQVTALSTQIADVGLRLDLLLELVRILIGKREPIKMSLSAFDLDPEEHEQTSIYMSEDTALMIADLKAHIEDNPDDLEAADILDQLKSIVQEVVS